MLGSHRMEGAEWIGWSQESSRLELGLQQIWGAISHRICPIRRHFPATKCHLILGSTRAGLSPMNGREGHQSAPSHPQGNSEDRHPAFRTRKNFLTGTLRRWQKGLRVTEFTTCCESCPQFTFKCSTEQRKYRGFPSVRNWWLSFLQLRCRLDPFHMLPVLTVNQKGLC